MSRCDGLSHQSDEDDVGKEADRPSDMEGEPDDRDESRLRAELVIAVIGSLAALCGLIEAVLPLLTR